MNARFQFTSWMFLIHIVLKGTTCHDDFNECYFGDPCHHRGSCLNTIGSYRCKCFDGWLGEGEHCGKIDNSTSFHKCAEGYMGESCADMCLTNSMCQKNGVCTKRGRGLRCICSPGWIGRNCTTDVNECSRNPCNNTAMTCINTPGSFDCQCPQGWEGINCDIDINECKTSPCLNSGTCLNNNGSFMCQCYTGWDGWNCENDINECNSNPCNVTFTCTNSLGSYSCSKLQLQRKSPKGKSSAEITYTIVGSAILIILLVCSIATLVGIQTYKSNQRHVSTEVLELTMETKQMQLTIFNQRYNNQKQGRQNHKQNHKDHKQRMRVDQSSSELGQKVIELNDCLELANAKPQQENSQEIHVHEHHVRNMEQAESRPHINDQRLCQEHVNLQYDYYKKTEVLKKKKKSRSRPIWQY